MIIFLSRVSKLQPSRHPPPLPERRNYRGGGMASTIPPPHISFAPSFSSLLDVLRLGAPRPFYSSPASFISIFCFGVLLITFMFVFVFYEFFGSFCRSSPRRFRCLPSIAELLSHPHRDELPPYSFLYEVNVHAIGFFPCISFCLYSVTLLFFSLHFICYLLVIMLWP
jgi:hypothetical protein